MRLGFIGICCKTSRSESASGRIRLGQRAICMIQTSCIIEHSVRHYGSSMSFMVVSNPSFKALYSKEAVVPRPRDRYLSYC